MIDVTILWPNSDDDFQTVFAPHVEQITGDERNFTNISARVQVSEIVV